MPTYDYRCAACGHTLEIFHGMAEKPRRSCPKCKKPKLERLISAGGGVLFKGSGFYQTDYRSETYKDAAKKDSAAPAPSAPAPTPAAPKPAAPEKKKS
jgi:putative FmdB family regulatory protein